MNQSNFKTLIDAATESRFNKTYPDIADMKTIPNRWYMQGAKLPNELLLKALKALEFECDGTCARGINPCNARSVMDEILEALETK